MLYFGRRRGHRIPRVFHDRTNDLDHMDDTQLLEVYCLDRECILERCDEVWQTTHRPTHRRGAWRYPSASIFKSSLVKFGLCCFLVAISLDMLNVGLAKVGQAMTHVDVQLKIALNLPPTYCTMRIAHARTSYLQLVTIYDTRALRSFPDTRLSFRSKFLISAS